MKKLGIKGKMICIIIPIILAIIISFFALSSNQIVKLAKEKLTSQSQMYTADISRWTDNILAELNVYAKAIDEGTFQNDDQILQYLETSMGLNDACPNGIYLGDDSGVYLDGSGWVPDSDWVLTERDWYLEGKDHETIAFGAPYFDSLSKQMCVSASVRLQNSDAVRVLAADVYLDYVCEKMQQIESGIGGQAFLIQKDTQKILAHSDTELIDKQLSDAGMDSLYVNISNLLTEKENSSLLQEMFTVSGDSAKYLVCLNDISGTDWCLVTTVSQRQVLSALHWLESVMLLIAILASIVLLILLMKVTNGVVKPVRAVTGVLTDVAQGDFTRDIQVKGSDEIAHMGNSMQQFVVNMREIIKELTNTADWLKAHSKENEEASENLMASADEEQREMDTLKRQADVLTQTANRVSEEMTKLADIIYQTKQEGGQADSIIKETAAASRKGQNALGDIKNSMQEIEDTTFSLADQIKETSAAIDKINDMVTMIVQITSQTNLLSLNASIEAARAGEAGRGFAVVAQEIGTLAVNSGQAATDISKLTEEIQATMARANEHMEASVSGVKNSAQMVETASETFRNVFDKVEETDTIVHRMVDMVDEVNQVSSGTVQLAEDQLSAAQEITGSVERLSTCSQSVTENSSRVAGNAKALEEQANGLADRMKQFKV